MLNETPLPGLLDSPIVVDLGGRGGGDLEGQRGLGGVSTTDVEHDASVEVPGEADVPQASSIEDTSRPCLSPTPGNYNNTDM